MRVRGGASGDNGEALTALERAKACDYGELQENVARVKIALREFQEVNGKVSDEDVGNWDETFLDLCKYAQKGAYIAPDDGLSDQCITPIEKSPHRGNAPHRGDPQTLLLSPDL
ncbi:hypothetical protein M885DRAFT_577707 [Pelagophyceae sp. CCMP2097]|nr:hypothetical protein M885DRAFT_577707 [Pelagophyceae sp. CCMP2097]